MATETQRHREEYRKLKAIFCCFTLLLLYSVALWLCGSVALWLCGRAISAGFF